MARLDELRLMAKVARMYYRDGLRQVQITDRLNIHQSTVSRLLKRAEKEGIVRMTLTMPSGLHPELEDALQSAYGLREAIVVDAADQEDQIVRDLGAAAAFYLETTLKARDVVGISSWSAALLAMVEAMHPSPRAAGAHVVQILGGIGNPGAELHATQLTRRLANLLGGVATLLPAPGAVGSADARRVMLKDRYVQEAIALFKSITRRARRHRRGDAVEDAGRQRQRLLHEGAEIAERSRSGGRHLPALLRCRTARRSPRR